jgi:formylglycine-generating enzyme required for sulfatase activity
MHVSFILFTVLPFVEKFMNLAWFWHGLAREFRFGARAARRQESASRVLRGGSWNNNNRDNLLSSYRHCLVPADCLGYVGFRVVVEAFSGR